MRVKTTTSDDAVIAAGTRVIGEIVAREPLRVAGRVVGAVDVRGSLRVERDGLVRGRVSAARIEIEGVVVGELSAQGAVTIGPRAQVVGALSADRLAVERGAALAIDVDVRVEGLAGDATPRASRVASSAPSSGAEARARRATSPRPAASSVGDERSTPTAVSASAHASTPDPITVTPAAAPTPTLAIDPQPDAEVPPPPLRARYVVHARRREGVTLAPGDDALFVTERPHATGVEDPRQAAPARTRTIAPTRAPAPSRMDAVEPPPEPAPELIPDAEATPEPRRARHRVVERRRTDAEILPVPIEASMMAPADDGDVADARPPPPPERPQPTSPRGWPTAFAAGAQLADPPELVPPRARPTTFAVAEQLAAQMSARAPARATPSVEPASIEPAPRASQAPRTSQTPIWTVRRAREDDVDGGAPSKRLRLRPRKRGDT